MKILFSFYLICVCSFMSYGQAGYPEPKKTDTRLFYIQHSDNHNTYVYDANLKGAVINKSEPINEYRIVYTENGIKRSLTMLQEKLAYGLILIDSQSDLFTFHLAASDKLNFHLYYTKKEGARVYVTVNNHKIFLDKMFVKLESGFLGTNVKAEYVLFYGTDFNSGKSAVEKVLMD